MGERLHASATPGAESASDADASPLGAREENAWSDAPSLRYARHAVMSLVLAVAFVFPAAFFGGLVYAGAAIGDDRCPRDLAGLVTWFGMLGLAAIAVSLADGADHASGFGIFLKLVLVAFPWVGTFWTFHLGPARPGQHCDSLLRNVSAVVWT